MLFKRVLITLNESQHKKAIKDSESLFGKVNVSGYVQILIENGFKLTRKRKGIDYNAIDSDVKKAVIKTGLDVFALINDLIEKHITPFDENGDNYSDYSEIIMSMIQLHGFKS